MVLPKQNGFQRNTIKIYVIATVLGLFSGSIMVYAAFAPNDVLSADQLNQTRSLGVDQQWVNMLDANNPTTQTRSTGVPYQNDTGRPIQVLLTVVGSAGSQFSISTSQNGPWSTIAESGNSNSAGDMGNISVIVPPNLWYKYDTSSLHRWYELREVVN
jgi:hypothetical protein